MFVYSKKPPPPAKIALKIPQWGVAPELDEMFTLDGLDDFSSTRFHEPIPNEIEVGDVPLLLSGNPNTLRTQGRLGEIGDDGSANSLGNNLI